MGGGGDKYMGINDLVNLLIKTYPLKTPDKPGIDWLQANREKFAILRTMENDVFDRCVSHLFSYFPDENYKLAVGSLFGVGIVTDSVTKEFESSYYLKTGVLFGMPVGDSFKFLFEIEMMYNKLGKVLTIKPDKQFKETAINGAKDAITRVLLDFYEVSQT